MATYLLNSPVLTGYGSFQFEGPISSQDARAYLDGGFESAVGHDGAAAFLSTLLEMDVPVNRVRIDMQPGDRAVVLRLLERLPAGETLTAEQTAAFPHELGVLVRQDDPGERTAAAEVDRVRTRDGAITDPASKAPQSAKASGNSDATNATDSIGTVVRQPRAEWFQRVTRNTGRGKETFSVFAVLFVSLIALAVAHGAVAEIWRFLDHGERIVAGVAAGVLFVAGGLYVYQRRFHRHRALGSALLLLLGALLIIFEHFFGFWVHELFLHEEATEGNQPSSGQNLTLILALTSIIMLVCLSILHRMRDKLKILRGLREFRYRKKTDESVESLQSQEDRDWTPCPEKPAQHLIIPISPPSWRPTWPSKGSGAVFSDQDKRPLVQLEGDISKDIRAMDRRFNWQQTLRAIRPHVGHVAKVYLIGSPPSESDTETKTLDEEFEPGKQTERSKAEAIGSFAFLKEAKRFLAPYLGEKRIKTHAVPVDFVSVDALLKAINSILNEINSSDHDEAIVIDATGALKTTSIVGAVATLNSDVIFQYVDTRPPFDVYLFDRRMDLGVEVH
ncbi:MAG: DUF1874 domain-containing protein [Planctomycetota bacterium]